VDLVGIEPTTSSMPWNEQNGNLLTAKDLTVGMVAENRRNRRYLRPNCAQELTSGPKADLWGISLFNFLGDIAILIGTLKLFQRWCEHPEDALSSGNRRLLLTKFG
jgi:hypothetical protein